MKKVDFENGTIAGNIFKTALPMLVAQIISLLYNIVDRIYIGRIPEIGTLALGAVGLCFPVIILVAAFTNMFGLGGAPLFSIELGKKDYSKARAVLNSAFRLEIFFALILTAFCEIFSPAILRAFGAGESELIFSVPYIRIYLIGTVFTMIATGMNPYINAQGFSMIGMTTVLIGALSNIILDPLFMFTLGLGVKGAAIATIISQFLSMAFVLSFLFGKKNDYEIYCSLKIPTEDGDKVFPYAKEIASLGTAPFVMQCTNALVNIACNNVLINTGGAMYVSVMTIISSVRQILDTPIMAFTEGASPTLSYNYGANRPKKVRKAIRIMASIAISYTLVMWIIIEKQPLLFISIFSEDQTLQQMALRPLHLYFFAFVCQSLQYSGQSVFKALNKKKQAIFFSIFRKVIMVVPLTYILPYVFKMGTDGVFIAEPVSNVIGGLASFIAMILMIYIPLGKVGEKDI